MWQTFKWSHACGKDSDSGSEEWTVWENVQEGSKPTSTNCSVTSRNLWVATQRVDEHSSSRIKLVCFLSLWLNLNSRTVYKKIHLGFQQPWFSYFSALLRFITYSGQTLSWFSVSWNMTMHYLFSIFLIVLLITYFLIHIRDKGSLLE